MTYTTSRHQVQHIYDYINNDMIGNHAFTDSMIAETRNSADMAYYRLTRTERRKVNRWPEV